MLLFMGGWLLPADSTGQATERAEVEVAPYLQLQYGAFFKQLKINCSDERVDEIEGFDFEWGFKYRLKVEVTTLEQPPADAGIYRTRLLKVVEQRPVPADYTFPLLLERDALLGPGEQESAVVQLTDSTYRYLDAVEIHVPTELRATFVVAAAEERSRWQCRITGPQHIRLLALLP